MSDLSEKLEISDDSDNIHTSEKTEKHLIFSILGKLYSFQSRHIGEIAIFDTVYPLPLLPPYVLGVINRFSVPYALFDIGILFYNTPSPLKKILVLKDEIDRIAFLIDDVEGIADIRCDQIIIKDRSIDDTGLTEAVSASFEWEENNVFVLDIHKILARAQGEI